MRRACLLIVLGLTVLTVVGCGRSSVAIVRPKHPIYVACHDMKFDARRLLGLSEGKGNALAEGYGCKVRVIEENGKSLTRTADLMRYRIDVAVTADQIVKVISVG